MLLPQIAERRSPRAFDPGHLVSGPKLDSMLEAARWAPSAMNRQPWMFLVGQRGDATFKGVFEALKPGNQLWAGSASALLVALVDLGEGRDPARSDAGRAYELGLAVGQLGVQAQHLGLITHQMGGFEAEQLVREFAIPAHLRPMAVVAVGAQGDPEELPADLRQWESAPRQRKPLPQIARRDGWR